MGLIANYPFGKMKGLKKNLKRGYYKENIKMLYTLYYTEKTNDKLVLNAKPQSIFQIPWVNDYEYLAFDYTGTCFFREKPFLDENGEYVTDSKLSRNYLNVKCETSTGESPCSFDGYNESKVLLSKADYRKILPKNKTYTIIRKDLDMSVGKMIAQSTHAVQRLNQICHSITHYEYKNINCKSIAVWAKDEKEMRKIIDWCHDNRINVGIQKDSGRTEVEPNTLTAIAIHTGLDLETAEKINKKLKRLRVV